MSNMSSQEVKQLCGGFLAQVRGIFSGIEKLPGVMEEIEAREQALASKASRVVELDKLIAQKTSDLAGIDAKVQGKALSEQHRRRVEMDETLKGLTARIAAEEARLTPLQAEIAVLDRTLQEKKALLATLKG